MRIYVDLCVCVCWRKMCVRESVCEREGLGNGESEKERRESEGREERRRTRGKEEGISGKRVKARVE